MVGAGLHVPAGACIPRSDDKIASEVNTRVQSVNPVWHYQYHAKYVLMQKLNAMFASKLKLAFNIYIDAKHACNF